MQLQKGDLVKWSTLPDGLGTIKEGVVQEIRGRWITLLPKVTHTHRSDHIQDVTLIEFILDPPQAVALQPRLF